MPENPFDSIESAHQYVSLLNQQVQEVKDTILEDITLAMDNGEKRRVDALRLVEYKLGQLADHLTASGRILNDLRAIRRLLLAQRESPSHAVRDEAAAPTAQAPSTL